MRNLVVVNRDLERTTLRELVQKSEKEEQLRAIHESLLLLDERLLWNKDTLAVDLWLPDRASEPQLHDIVGRVLASDCRFQVLAELAGDLWRIRTGRLNPEQLGLSTRCGDVIQAQTLP